MLRPTLTCAGHRQPRRRRMLIFPQNAGATKLQSARVLVVTPCTISLVLLDINSTLVCKCRTKYMIYRPVQAFKAELSEPGFQVRFPDFLFLQLSLFIIEPTETIIVYNIAQEPNSDALLARSCIDRNVSAKQRLRRPFNQQPFP